MKSVCPLHKTELIYIDKYILGCNNKTKYGKCQHIRYTNQQKEKDNEQ